MSYLSIEEVLEITSDNGETPLRINKLKGNNDNFYNEIIAYGKLPTSDIVGKRYCVSLNSTYIFTTSIVREVIELDETKVMITTNNSTYQIEVIS